MFQHILVPLDGSLHAESARPVAARIARATDGSLLLVQVVSPPIDYSGGLAQAPFLTEQLIETETAEATDYLTAMAASPRDEKIRRSVSDVQREMGGRLGLGKGNGFPVIDHPAGGWPELRAGQQLEPASSAAGTTIPALPTISIAGTACSSARIGLQRQNGAAQAAQRTTRRRDPH